MRQLQVKYQLCCNLILKIQNIKNETFNKAFARLLCPLRRGRSLYCATPAVTQSLGFYGLIQGTSSFSLSAVASFSRSTSQGELRAFHKRDPTEHIRKHQVKQTIDCYIQCTNMNRN